MVYLLGVPNIPQHQSAGGFLGAACLQPHNFARSAIVLIFMP